MSIAFNDRDIISLPNADVIVDPVTFRQFPIGGGRFQEEQGTPYALAGLKVRSGTLIDAVIPIYQELKDDGTLGEEIEGLRYGGFGGGERKIVKQGYVVVGLSLYQGLYVDQVSIVWQRWTAKGLNPGDTDKSSSAGGVGGGPEEIKAQPGHVAIGIHGKAGSVVDRLSLITARPSFS